jgi:hypothetical protein
MLMYRIGDNVAAAAKRLLIPSFELIECAF